MTVFRTDPFVSHVADYDRWFERHRAAYESELSTIGELLPADREGIEIGVGTGRFAAPLGVRIGVDPSTAMLDLAAQRGISVLAARAEALPFSRSTFGLVLMVTTICFLDDPHRALREAHRVLAHHGHLVIGFIDSASPLGRSYLEHRKDSVFYRQAHFHTTGELITWLHDAGFEDPCFRQTLFHPPDILKQPDATRAGYGQGSFVAVRVRKGSAQGGNAGSGKG